MAGKELAAVDKANLPKPEASMAHPELIPSSPSRSVTPERYPHRDRHPRKLYEPVWVVSKGEV